jgi:hypothetical protein
MSLISRRKRGTRQPHGSIRINRANSLGAKVIEYLPLNAYGRAVVSGANVSLAAPGSLRANARGVSLRAAGSGVAATVPLNLSAYNAISIAFFGYVDAYNNTDKFFLELTSNSQTTNGGFYIDPDSGAAGRFDIAARNAGISGYDTFMGARPAASWNHYIVTIDMSANLAITLTLNGNNLSSSGTTLTAGVTGNFADSTLYIGGRSGGVFSLTGGIQDVTFFRGVLSPVEKRRLYENPDQIIQVPERRVLVAASAPAGDAIAYPAGTTASGSTGSASASGAANTSPSGISAVSSIGTAAASGATTVNATATPAGVSAAASIGSATGSGGASIAASGVPATASVGTATASGATVVHGNASAAGVSAASATGTAAASGQASVTASGVSATASVGTASATAGTVVHGTATPAGVSATASRGAATVSAGANGSPPGVSVLATIGSPIASGQIFVSATALPAGVIAYASTGTAVASDASAPVYARAPAGSGYAPQRSNVSTRPSSNVSARPANIQRNKR